MQQRPVIGITSRKIHHYHQNRPYHRYGVAIGYIQAVEAAGGLPVMIPLTQDEGVLGQFFSMLDGLLLPGGMDIDPIHYGEEPHRKLEEVDPVRDVTELYLTRRALADDLPIFGVCRGHQLLNVAAGGSLFQDLHELSGKKTLRHFQEVLEECATHAIDIAPGSRLHSIVGQATARVNSYHHQSVNRLAPGFRITATASDGIVEAIESTQHTYALGVQWHPELQFQNLDFNLALFRRHVEEAARARLRRAAPSR